jgi:hypothetical protein
VIRFCSYALGIVVGVVDVEIILCYHAAKILNFTKIKGACGKKDEIGKFSVNSDKRLKWIPS